MSSLQHQVHQLHATCTLLEQQQQAANTSTTAVASSIRKLEQRMQQLEQQGQRQSSSSKAADSAVVQRLQTIEQQVACLADSATETQVMRYLDAYLKFALCSSAMSTVAAAATHEDQLQVAVQMQHTIIPRRMACRTLNMTAGVPAGSAAADLVP
jgi:DNA repair exonuclease SbcCD ATPase subunit